MVVSLGRFEVSVDAPTFVVYLLTTLPNKPPLCDAKKMAPQRAPFFRT